MSHNVTVIAGDGIGPEVINATRKIIEASGVKINWEECDAGASVFKKGLGTGVPEETINSISKNKVALKGPLETPVGFGEKSANVTLRKLFATYGNIRPVKEMPGVHTPYSGRKIDLVIVRENIEDLYAGIEYMQSPNVAQGLKLISSEGCEKIVRLAFAVAQSQGRKTVHCATKANIMKLTEGMLKKVFEKVAPEYPEIEAKHIIVDNCAHQLVKKPEQFSVIVTTNMNGDILSDLSSALIGGLGFAPSANIGDEFAIFEAVHGSAPKYAGQNTINPTAALMSGILMLRHLGEFTAAQQIENALYVTMFNDKHLTRDVVGDAKAVSTSDFTSQIIKNLGRNFTDYQADNYQPLKIKPCLYNNLQANNQQTLGVDLFLQTTTLVNQVGQDIEKILLGSKFLLKLIANRGVKVYPEHHQTVGKVSDVLRCRIISTDGAITDKDISHLLQLFSSKYHWMHVEKLQTFDGVDGFTKSHNEN